MSSSGQYMAARVGRTPTTGVPPNITGYAPGVVISGMQSWTIDPSVMKLNGRTAEQMGFPNPEFGVSDCAVNLELIVQATTAHLLSIPGATLLDVRLYASGFNTLPSWQFPTLRLFGCTHRGEVEGQHKLSVKAEPAGPFRGPGQAEWTAAEVAAINSGNYASVFTIA